MYFLKPALFPAPAILIISLGAAAIRSTLAAVTAILSSPAVTRSTAASTGLALAAGFGRFGFDAARTTGSDGLIQFSGVHRQVQQTYEKDQGHHDPHPRRSSSGQQKDSGDAGEEGGDGHDHFSVNFSEFIQKSPLAADMDRSAGRLI